MKTSMELKTMQPLRGKDENMNGKTVKANKAGLRDSDERAIPYVDGGSSRPRETFSLLLPSFCQRARCKQEVTDSTNSFDRNQNVQRTPFAMRTSLKVDSVQAGNQKKTKDLP